MAKCIITSQTPLFYTDEERKGDRVLDEDGREVDEFEVILEADDGYQEPQKYQLAKEALTDLVTHFNDEHFASLRREVTKNLSQVEAPEKAPEVLTVKASTQAKADRKEYDRVVPLLPPTEGEEGLHEEEEVDGA